MISQGQQALQSDNSMTYEDFVLVDEKPDDIAQEDWGKWETILCAANQPAWARKPKTLHPIVEQGQ